MAKFTTGELNSFIDTQLISLQDECNLYSYSSSQNSYGEQIASYTVTSGVSCGLNMTNGTEVYKGTVIKTESDAVLRLPINTTISVLDKVEITKRYGVTVSGMFYEVVEPARRGVSGLQVRVKRVDY